MVPYHRHDSEHRTCWFLDLAHWWFSKSMHNSGGANQQEVLGIMKICVYLCLFVYIYIYVNIDMPTCINTLFKICKAEIYHGSTKKSMYIYISIGEYVDTSIILGDTYAKRRLCLSLLFQIRKQNWDPWKPTKLNFFKRWILLRCSSLPPQELMLFNFGVHKKVGIA